MNDVTRNEVDVIVMETKVSIANTISPQLVEFSLLHPLPALNREGAQGTSYTHDSLWWYLGHWGLIEVQLEPHGYLREVSSMETNDIFQFTWRRLVTREGGGAVLSWCQCTCIINIPFLSKVDSLQYTNSSCCVLGGMASMDVVCMAVGAVFKQSLSLLIHTWAIQQTLQLTGSSKYTKTEQSTVLPATAATHLTCVSCEEFLGHPAQLLGSTAPLVGPTK